MQWDITVKPTATPVTWASMRARLNLDDAGQRETVTEMVDEATAYAEERMQCSLMRQTITAKFWECEPVHLPRGPVASVTSVVDGDGNALTYTQSKVGNSDRLALTSNPTAYPVTVTYTAGAASADDVPADIRGVIREHAATKYLHRETVSATSLTPLYNIDEFYRRRGRGVPVA
jgi:uncharacterized phiE125 gp8 family phage protein